MTLEELSKKDFFTIGEVSRLCGVPEYTIRYWEKNFTALSPVKKASHHRRYTKADVEVVLQIKELIYKHKMTVAGAKKHLNRFFSVGRQKEDPNFYSAKNLRFLKEIREILSQILKEC